MQEVNEVNEENEENGGNEGVSQDIQLHEILQHNTEMIQINPINPAE